MVCPDQRHYHGAVRAVPAGGVWTFHGAGAGAQAALPAGRPDHGAAGGPGPGLYLQFRLDPLCRAGAGERAPDGLILGFGPGSGAAHRGVHPGLCAALPSGGAVHRRGAVLLQAAPAGGALDGEGGGGSADPDGGDDLYRLYERLHRISVPDRLRRASEPERRQRGGAVRLHRCRQRCVGAAGGPCP